MMFFAETKKRFRCLMSKTNINHMENCHVWMAVLLAVVMLSACKPSVPGRYIQPNDMEQILYDYHMADAAYKLSGSGYETKDIIAFKAAILKEHGFTEAEFDSSMYYYVRHTQRLHEIYEHLSDRLSKEALAMGASLSDVGKYDMLSQEGDTANVWPGARAMVLSPIKPFNLSTFRLEADTTYLPGDKYILEFDTKFHYQDGMRDATAMLAVRLGNDSVITHLTRITTSMHYSVQLADNKWQGIKSLQGFFLLHPHSEELSSTGLHLFVVENIRLVRMHAQGEPPKPVQPSDSIPSDSILPEKVMVKYGPQRINSDNH